jgi:peptidoglycan-associated lipoprotein
MNGRILSIFLTSIFLFSACSYTQKVKDGRTALERKQYSVAVRLLEKEHNQSKSRVEKGKLAFLMGESYKHLNKSPQSIRWYQIAYDNQYGVDALREMAFALKRAERYKEAIQAFKDLGIEIGSPYEYRREVNACEIAIGWKTAEPQAEYAVHLLEFSGSYADYSPIPYKDGKLVFTSDRPTEKGSPVYAWTGNSFSNLYIADLQTNAVTLFDPNVNSPDNDGTATFNPDFTEMIFSRCFGGKKEDAFCKLMSSDLRNGAWSAPRILDFVQDQVNYVQPSLSADGRYLYFSSNHPDGWGGYDIYVSERKGGNWDEPVLLGRSINTTGDEKFPFIDNDTLYFSSDAHTGMGGLDIFRSYKLPNGTWSPPYNLKPPVNSGGDDFGFVLAARFPEGSDVLETGFFTSTREDGNGNDDIYRYEKRLPPPMPVADTTTQIRPEDVQMFLDVYVVEKIYENPANPNSKVLGRKPLPGAQTDMRQGNDTRKWTIEEEGFFSIPLQEEADYAFLASKPGYLNNAATFSTKGIGKDPTVPEMRFELEIVLERIFLDKEIRLENIYYDFDRWEIRDDAKPTLDRLARLLVINPAVRIQLGSHTDCRGNDRYNQDLSQKRAQSAVDYLIAKGISAERLSAFGFGETTPEVSCLCNRCTEDEHQQNRRTTFRILE